jgi:hypothetical protein
MMASALIMLFLVVAQSGRHYAIVAEMKRLESVQSAWIEENRKLLSNIAVAASRARVDASMKSAEGYGRMGPANTLRIELVPKKERLDG